MELRFVHAIIDDTSQTFTIIDTFIVAPADADEIVDALRDFSERVTFEMRGFVGASVHLGGIGRGSSTSAVRSRNGRIDRHRRERAVSRAWTDAARTRDDRAERKRWFVDDLRTVPVRRFPKETVLRREPSARALRRGRNRKPHAVRSRRHDAVPLCAFARFCDNAGGIWSVVAAAEDGVAVETVVHEAALCPSGRLVLRDVRTNDAVEPELERSIAVVEDPAKNCSGPLWLRGGIPVFSADGTSYDVRNRQTLCRCGRSASKPFCDGTHADIDFRDGYRRRFRRCA